jgi:hypothetical protein
VDFISSGSPRPRFTMTPRHEMRRLNGLAPVPPRAVVASFRGLGAGLYSDPGFPVFPLVVYGILIGLMVGSGRRRG